jgi:Mn-containing catalase
MDGKSSFEYIADPKPMGQIPNLVQAPSYVHDSPIPRQPTPLTDQTNYNQPLQ